MEPFEQEQDINNKFLKTGSIIGDKTQKKENDKQSKHSNVSKNKSNHNEQVKQESQQENIFDNKSENKSKSKKQKSVSQIESYIGADKEDIIKRAFNFIDFNKDGKLTIEEIRKMVESMGYKLKEGDVHDMINEVDLDGNGFINITEFRELLDNRVRKDSATNEEMIETFRYFDKDGDGLISTNDLFKAMNELGQNVKYEQAEDMVRLADKDGDDHLSYKEFKEMMKSQS